MQPEPTRSANDKNDELRVLIVAPTGRDAMLLCAALERGGMHGVSCPSCDSACGELLKGAAAMIIAEEALNAATIQRLAELMADQPAWSDFPLIVLTLAGEVTAQTQQRRLLREPLAGALELERPIRPETLISTVRTAIRARQRQYQIRDYIEAKKLAEQALLRSEKLAVAGRLAASIAHEINNPLAAVINLVYLARTSRSQAQVPEFLKMAEAELARVSAITTETLKFYRQPNKATVVDLKDILESLLLLYREKIVSGNLTVNTEFAPDLPPLTAFGGELRQAFSNLINNAIDAATDSRLEIRTRRSTDAAGREGVRVVVADTGYGIPDTVKKAVFEPFVSTKGARGTGLGLWITSEIIAKHGGSIRVKSCTQPNRRGTVFSIFLPSTGADVAESPSERKADEHMQAAG